MSAFLDWLGQFGSAAADTAGTIGGGVATYIGRRFINAEKNARKAIAVAQEAKRIVDGFSDRFDALKKGLELELADFKNEMLQERSDFKIGRRADDLSPQENERRYRDLVARVEELKGDINRERGARHALQKQIADESREDARQWLEIQKMVSRIEGGFEIVKTQYLTMKRD